MRATLACLSKALTVARSTPGASIGPPNPFLKICSCMSGSPARLIAARNWWVSVSGFRGRPVGLVKTRPGISSCRRLPAS